MLPDSSRSTIPSRKMLLPEVAEVLPTLVRQRWYGGKIIMYQLRDTQRPTIDAWMTDHASCLLGWPIRTPFTALYDLSDKNVTLSTYMRSRLPDLIGLLGGSQAAIAVVLPNTSAAQLLRLALLGEGRGRIQLEIFPSNDSGMTWLKKIAGIPANW